MFFLLSAFGCFWISAAEHSALLAKVGDTGGAEDCVFDWYRDADGDGAGAADVTTTACEAPLGFVAFATDCDDSDAAVNPDAVEMCNGNDDNCDGAADEDAIDADTWYADLDVDGFGDGATAYTGCEAPAGMVPNADDCDDNNAAVSPAAVEVCNEIDDDCDEVADENDAADALTRYLDADFDGYGDGETAYQACQGGADDVQIGDDCDDGDASVNPAGIEVCNTIDDDCDGLIDDEDDDIDLSTATTEYEDDDVDGFGDPAEGLLACLHPEAYVSDATDCDDSDGLEFPGADETCDGDDDNCNGEVDESSAIDASAWYADTDGDTYGDPAASQVSCSSPAGFVADDSDCDDSKDAVNPGEAEVCNSGVDDDCSGAADDGDPGLDLSTTTTWYTDGDADGFGDAGSNFDSCDVPSGYVADDTDCDDTLPAVNPDATEVCNEIDDDCDVLVDDDDDGLDLATATTWYADADGDGAGDEENIAVSCDAPADYVAASGDCNDDDDRVTPASDPTKGQVTFIRSTGALVDYTSAFLAGVAGAGYTFELAEDGDLRVCPGTWYVNVYNPTYAFTLTGYGGAENVVLDGDNNNAVVMTLGGSAAISDVTIANGSDQMGGGISLCNSNVTVEGSILTGNSGYYGGAIGDANRGYSCSGGSLAVANSIISGNTGTYGGGIYVQVHVNTTVTDTVITGNIATNAGGGVNATAEGLTITGGEISGNDAPSGGGIYFECNGTNGSVSGTLISGNTATIGGGVYNGCNNTVNLTDVTLTENDATYGGGFATVGESNNHTVLTDSVVFDNTADYGGGAYTTGAVECYGSVGVSAGFWGNAASTLGGGVYLVDDSYKGSLESDSCDWAGTANNSPDDVYAGGGYSYGDDETFLCTADGGCAP